MSDWFVQSVAQASRLWLSRGGHRRDASATSPRFGSALFVLIAFAAVAHGAATPSPDGIAFFEQKIRPVLSDHCYKCHSADAVKAGKLKGELLLDTRDGVLKGGKSGPEIVPGKPAESRLIEAVRYGNEDLQMPPKDRLAPEIVADLEKWVAMGAPDPRAGGPAAVKAGIDIDAGKKFWSFQPLHAANPPIVKNGAWGRTPIDRFVLAELEEKGLVPNGIASREKLIRRAYFDLIGLPPTPEQIENFRRDASPDAYGKVIDQLLENPHYGERWGRHWLDVARFGESDGFEQDYDRPAAYQYRDFVIRALNRDMPFDQFVQWQIAGDELAPNDWQALAATGFLTAGVFPTQITEKEFESTRYNQLDDMIANLGSAMLGLTVGCARCHDHKYDPIGTIDYYRMAATFATAIRSDIERDIATPAEKENAQRQWKAKIADLKARLADFDRGGLDAAFAQQIDRLRKSPKDLAGEWSVPQFEKVSTQKGAKLVAQPDGSWLVQGPTPARDVFTFVARTGAAPIAALRLEALADKSLPHNGPGAAPNGNFALSEIEVTARPASGEGAAQLAPIAAAVATHQQNDGSLSVRSSFDGKSDTGWAVDRGGIGMSQAAIFTFAKPVEYPGGTLLTITLRFEHPSAHHLIGRPRISLSARADASDFHGHEGADPVIAAIYAHLAAGEQVSDLDREKARGWLAAQLPQFKSLKQEIDKLLAEGPAKTLVKIQVTSEGLPPVKNNADGRGYPHFYKTVYLLRRGDPNNKVEPVTESFPRVLMRDGKDESSWESAAPEGSTLSYRRAALARWMTDADHGAGNLLARVIVNRLWLHHFGRGIVATPNDFGAQGERPTHPELLEWLANDLVRHGWQLKRLHKLMMTSSAYMEDAQIDAANQTADPRDAFYWRWQPRRLEAEPIRDAMLSVAGMLDDTMFGPGTLDQNMRRRSVYFTVKRSQLIPMMMVLDWPEPLGSVGLRPTTTVAPQALLFMNSPQARQYAEAFARRVRSASLASSIDQAYQIAYGRLPEEKEVRRATVFIERQAAAYREGRMADPTLAALADFCQAIMGGNEFVYVD